MSLVRTWHLWRCDHCGKEVSLQHGEFAEPRIPTGWYATIGWGLHACWAGCRDAIQAAQKRETGKLYLWDDRERRKFEPQAPPAMESA